jgi:regulatory protein
MIITRIARQKRLKNSYSIYLDGSYAFSLSGESIIRHRLKEGREVVQADVDGVFSEEEKRRALEYAIKLFTIRSRSAWELRQRLKEKEFSESAISHAAGRLSDLGYLNDERFASDRANYLMAKGYGPELIRAELKRKGIAADIITDVLARFRERPEAEIERVEEIARRKLKAMKDVEPAAAAHRLTGFLVRRGFSIDSIRHVLRELLNEQKD